MRSNQLSYAPAAHDLRGYLHKLQTQPPKADYYIPQERKPLGPKSIRNAHATLSSFWNWAVGEGFVGENIAQAIEPPKPKRTVIEPFNEGEIKALLQAAGRDSETTLRLRDRAILPVSSRHWGTSQRTLQPNGCQCGHQGRLGFG